MLIWWEPQIRLQGTWVPSLWAPPSARASVTSASALSSQLPSKGSRDEVAAQGCRPPELHKVLTQARFHVTLTAICEVTR